MEILKKSQKTLNRAVKALSRGGIIICPTDTVYGFLADTTNRKAVVKIFKIKKRPKSKPLPVFVKDLKMAREIAEIGKKQEEFLKKAWPGKVTVVLKTPVVEQSSLRGKGKPKFKLYGVARGTIAIRIPKYKFLNNLLKKINKPLAQTSVNISGEPTLNKISDVVKKFGKSEILIIDGGDIKKSKPSRILDMTRNKIKILRK